MARIERTEGQSVRYRLVSAAGEPVPIVQDFLAHLLARGCSPNTVAAYAFDLRHLWTFLEASGLPWNRMLPPDAIGLLAHLRSVAVRRRRRAEPSLLAAGGDRVLGLSAAAINRALAAAASLYEFAIVAGRLDGPNPLACGEHKNAVPVTDRHRPFLDGIARRSPIRRGMRVRTALRLPRPLEPEQVAALVGCLRCKRDLALVRLMLDGGLRPGEALALRVADVAYGRRRVVIRHDTEHPKGVRPKSRTERVVDLHEPETLAAVADYMMSERPVEADSPYLFLVGGHGRRRLEPLSYAALAKLFARAAARAGIREAWVTPHALRHTHATRMWEGGMRELALQRRLGHASPVSTRIYTRVSDAAVVAEYRRAVGLDREVP
ncbi:tyrosine-type recombinase/integrase [Azospirillum sp. 11R-A]|uniref:tyrosine-type recombinase/integrase n=1 Tax=Azospirillum sp. 11R-A TaxID=3111634 RepID=UPI003C23FD9B